MIDPAGMEDIIAVQRVLSGDTSAFGLLVERHGGPLARFCEHRLGCHEDAEDAVQEVFLRAYRSLRSFRLGSSFKAWLFTIAANRIKTRYARRDRENELRRMAEAESAASCADGPGGNSEADAMRALEIWAARTAISGLSSSNRPVAELYYVAGLNVEEIAESLGLRTEAVKARLFRARKEIFRNMRESATDAGFKG